MNNHLDHSISLYVILTSRMGQGVCMGSSTAVAKLNWLIVLEHLLSVGIVCADRPTGLKLKSAIVVG
jgi:hypothetical protein